MLSPLAWCASIAPILSPRPCPLPCSPRRRPRPCFPLSCQSADITENHSPKSPTSPTSPASPASPASSIPSNPTQRTEAVTSKTPVQISLLTDSVLELKWKNEARIETQRRQQQVEECKNEDDCETSMSMSMSITSMPKRPSTSQLPKLQDDDNHDDDLSASDPYQAFARFTRIAAPTAALGQSASEGLQVAPPTDKTKVGNQQNQITSYSTASIAQRLLRYQNARHNLREFMRLFIGEFDNCEQVAAERIQGEYPGESGGHEHIHCSIAQVSSDLLFARYYFNGNPSRVFRTRLYYVRVDESCDRGIVEMRICKFYEETERKLRENGYDFEGIEWTNDDMYDWMHGCDVFWERYYPRDGEIDEAVTVLGISPGGRFVGYMKGGGCEVYSKEVGGRIRVMDDLLLTKEELWVADRGFDERDQFVYGNRRGIPYKMRRVREHDQNAWTLSEKEAPPRGYVP